MQEVSHREWPWIYAMMWRMQISNVLLTDVLDSMSTGWNRNRDSMCRWNHLADGWTSSRQTGGQTLQHLMFFELLICSEIMHTPT